MRVRHTMAMAALMAALIPGVMAEPSVRALVDALQGDPAARVEAAALLPRYGVEPLPLLFPLLTNQSPTVAKAAENVVWDISCQAARPGQEADAREATRLLLERLAQETGERQRRHILRCLSVVVPEGYDIGPLGELLNDPAQREPVRTTLERIATTEAKRALREAVDERDPDFTVALLNSLAQLRDAEALPVARKMLSHGSAEVRVAAARAVAWCGDPVDAVALLAVRDCATPETTQDATDAVLMLADAMAERGGNWDEAIGLYKSVLASTDIPVMRDAAICGLAKYGDETVVAPILAAVEGLGERETAIAVAALETVAGAAADKAIADAYATQPADIKPLMIAMMGRRGGTTLLPAIVEASASTDPALRLAGITALGDAGRLESLPALAAAMDGGDADAQAAARDSAFRLADGLRARGESDSAGKVYAELFRRVDTTELRRRAFEGIVACPVPEAFEAVLAAGQDVNLAELSGPGLVAMIGALAKSGRVDDARKSFDLVLQAPLVGPPVEQLAAALAGSAAELDVCHRLGFVCDWSLVGPFPFGGPGKGLGDVNVGEPNIDLGATYKVGDAELTWQRKDMSNPAGVCDLTQAYGMPTNQVAYAYTKITVPEAIDVVVRMGSDDGIKLWVNGEVVHDHDVDRPCKIDEDSAAAKLKAGENTLLVKISQGGGGWNFRLRFTTSEGRALPVDVVK